MDRLTPPEDIKAKAIKAEGDLSFQLIATMLLTGNGAGGPDRVPGMAPTSTHSSGCAFCDIAPHGCDGRFGRNSKCHQGQKNKEWRSGQHVSCESPGLPVFSERGRATLHPDGSARKQVRLRVWLSHTQGGPQPCSPYPACATSSAPTDSPWEPLQSGPCGPGRSRSGCVNTGLGGGMASTVSATLQPSRRFHVTPSGVPCPSPHTSLCCSLGLGSLSNKMCRKSAHTELTSTAPCLPPKTGRRPPSAVQLTSTRPQGGRTGKPFST